MIIKLASLTTTTQNKPKRNIPRPLVAGAALGGGIAIADAVTEGLFSKPGHRLQAALHGLAKGGVYGTALAVAEPGIEHVFKKNFNVS